ncbi:MAG: pilus assembly protein PilM [Candidatus Kerfeldbacteria bacterium]|nr:pilus assembly protein PilM [Candidatus Kerfeldbacteria bacterium]
MAILAQHVTTGIDVSDHKLRLVRLQHGYRNVRLHAFAELDLPEGIIQNGIILQPTAFVQALKELPHRVTGSHWSTRSVHVGVPEQISFMTTVAVTAAGREAAETAAKQSLPLQENEMYYDLAIQRTTKTATIAAARRDLLDQLLAQFDAANYEVVGLHVESEALANALLPHPLTKAPRSLVVDLGTARTSIVFVANGTIQFTVSYPSVFGTAGLLDQQLAGAMQQTVTYVQEHFGALGAPEQIVLCGSGALTPQLEQWLNQIVHIPVQLGNALLHVKPNHLSKKLSRATVFATALGLALAD